MRKLLGGFLTGTVLMASGIANAEAPFGIFRCVDRNTNPFATLLLDGKGMYQLIATRDASFAADPDAKHNGAGSYSVDSTFIKAETGPVHELFNEAGSFLGGGAEATISFTNGKGDILTCMPGW